jgi:hypothetical protein
MNRHRHRWSGVEFYLEADRPMIRQTCPCGAERRLRAFERYWDGQAARVSERRP